MKTHETVRLATLGQFKDLAATLIQVIPPDLTFEDANVLISKKGPFQDDVRQVFAKCTVSSSDAMSQVIQWQELYQTLFGLTKDFTDLSVPAKQPGFDRLIIEAGEITNNQAYDKCKSLFPACKYTDDLNSISDIAPWTAGDRAYWVLDRVEADEELEVLSANQLAEKKIVGITLRGRLLYELKYFKETGKHLDINNITLCSGSRYPNGNVPGVRWSSDELNVGWDNPGSRHGRLRARSAVYA